MTRSPKKRGITQAEEDKSLILRSQFALDVEAVDNKNNRTRNSSFSMNENNKKLPSNKSVNLIHLC
jgi:hypothetical protein